MIGVLRYVTKMCCYSVTGEKLNLPSLTWKSIMITCIIIIITIIIILLVHLDPGIWPAWYRNLKNGRIIILTGYRVCLGIQPMRISARYWILKNSWMQSLTGAPVSGQEIWPDTEFASVSDGRITGSNCITSILVFDHIFSKKLFFRTRNDGHA